MFRFGVRPASSALFLLGVFLCWLAPAEAQAACPWSWIKEQNQVIEREPLESIRVIQEIDAFTRKDLPGRSCREAVSRLHTLSREKLEAHAAFLKIDLRGSAGVRAEEVTVSLDTEPVSQTAFVAGPGEPVIPGSHDIVVSAPFDDAQRVTTVEVLLNGRSLKRVPGPDPLFRFNAVAGQTHELEVRISLVTRRCFLMQVKPTFQAGVPNIPLILHGVGAGYRLQRGAHPLEAQRYSLQVDSSSVRNADGLKVRVLFDDQEVAPSKTKAGLRYELTPECSAGEPKSGTLEVRLGTEEFVGRSDVKAVPSGSGAGDSVRCGSGMCKLPALFWVGSGLGAAGLITAGVAHFGIRNPAESESAELFSERGCGEPIAASCDQATQSSLFSLYDEADAGATWTVVGLVTAGAGTALAVGALLLDGEPDTEAARGSAPRRALVLTPVVGNGDWGVVARGRF